MVGQMELHLHLHTWGRDPAGIVCRIVERLGPPCTPNPNPLERIMATLDQLLEQVRANKTLLGSLNTLLDGLRVQIADILSGAALPPAIQAKIDQVFAEAQQTGQELADVVVENTDVIPTEPPAPDA